MKKTTTTPNHFSMSKENVNTILIQRSVAGSPGIKSRGARAARSYKKHEKSTGNTQRLSTDTSPKIVLHLFDENYAKELQAISLNIEHPNKNNEFKGTVVRIIKKTLLR